MNSKNNFGESRVSNLAMNVTISSDSVTALGKTFSYRYICSCELRDGVDGKMLCIDCRPGAFKNVSGGYGFMVSYKDHEHDIALDIVERINRARAELADKL